MLKVNLANIITIIVIAAVGVLALNFGLKAAGVNYHV